MVSESWIAFVLLSSTPEASFKPKASLECGRRHQHSLLIDIGRMMGTESELGQRQSHALYIQNDITQHEYGEKMRCHTAFVVLRNGHTFLRRELLLCQTPLSQANAWWLLSRSLLVGALLGCRTAPVHPSCLCLKTPGAERRTCYNAWFIYSTFWVYECAILYLN